MAMAILWPAMSPRRVSVFQAYAIGLTPWSTLFLLANGFYAQKEYGMAHALFAHLRRMQCAFKYYFCIRVSLVEAVAAQSPRRRAHLSIARCYSRGLAKQIGSVSLWWSNGVFAVISCAAAIAATGADRVAPSARVDVANEPLVHVRRRIWRGSYALGLSFSCSRGFAWMKWKKASPETGEA